MVVAFFICWAPFHAQRLLAVYGQSSSGPEDTMVIVYTTLTYVSGVFYYLSATVNPLLYNIMSNKFREAFKVSRAREPDLIASLFTGDSHTSQFIIDRLYTCKKIEKMDFLCSV